MVVYAAQGDARRSMGLLWRAGSTDTARPGPRPALSIEMIIEAAIEIADADGMPGLSMRAVGERLGRTAMALYTYVANKNELLDLMYDHALAELPSDYSGHAEWRDALTAWARDNWDFFLRHPWLLQVSEARSVLGPNEFQTVETLIVVLDRLELPAKDVRRLVGTLTTYVRGAVRRAVEARAAQAETGMSDDEWWLTRSALLVEVAPDFSERYPALTRLESGRAFQMDDESVPYLEQEARETFRAGLATVLDGIEVALRRARIA
ncbi:TetR/AcrR family transcriptional regulator [Allokutzneria sp. NRRL B-24872]|uniref:TetR/AcrR family transcriptional regulator n=1 Tax=Allokutzneria sp. NRRL B-24872 TaxID=1137961 RepID=UPI000A3C9B2F|nr:TetR/AcrR family transcriptional regulator C-terminal domain-containing protein [Allokutzneria sp. NRRL B-24872]